jgi:RNA exonuclease 4
MDKTALSSNWKKLQATLKKDSTVKRKPSDRDSGDGIVKKRKLTEKQKPYNKDAKPTKRKRMSDKKENGDSADAPAPEIETSSRHKENEGRSPT